MSVKDFEDKRWRETPQKREFRHTEAAKLAEGATLDVGCGDGLFLKLLREKGLKAEGVDISTEAIALCRAAGFEAHQHSLDDALPFPDNSFDTVTLLDVLEHVYDPLFVLKEAERVARKSVVISVPNFSSLPARLQVLLGKVPENNRPNKGHLYWFNYPVLTALAQKTGWQIETLSMNTFSPFSKFGDVAQNAMPNIFALSFVARLTKKQ